MSKHQDGPAADDPFATLSAASGTREPGQVVRPDGPTEAFHGDPLVLVRSLRVVSDDEYVLGRVLAQGGMGRVIEAHDRRHDRPVAIKLMLAGGSLERFVREARIAARLQHPGIVPVYEAARLPTGEPFLVMKLVEGRSLDEAVSSMPALADRLALMPHLVAATEALAYAHSRHVVHRDLKPSNVLVGAYGETVVIDWGVATEGAPEEGPESDGTAPGPGLTIAGRAIGTPAYMAPEQARGERVDTRADVYSLGALLYHVLAGDPPYRADSAANTLAQVLTGPPQPIERRGLRIAPDLATIVGKAMARDPALRYPDAAGMAADLRRFTTGQLVAAHEYSLGALARRWIARHRAAVATATALLAVLAVTGIVAVRGIVRERDRADGLAQVASAQRAAAEELVDFLIVNLRGKLKELGRLDVLGDVGVEVDAYYSRVYPAARGGDADVLGRWAVVFETIADVARARRDQDGELAAHQRALELRREQRAQAPADPEPLREMAVTYLALADLARRGNRVDAGRQARAQAGELLGQLLAVDRDDPRVLQLRLSLLRQTADGHEDEGDLGAAEVVYRECLELARSASAAAPGDETLEAALGNAWFDLGRVYLNLDRYDDAEVAYRESVTVRRRLLERKPDDAAREKQLAWAQFRHADATDAKGDPAASLGLHETARATRQALATRDPSDRDVQRELAMSESALCRVLGRLDRLADALVHCQAGLAAAERLATAAPDDWVIVRDLTRRYLSQAYIELDLGLIEAALAHGAAVHVLATRAAGRDPGNRYWQRDLLAAAEISASAELARGRPDAARAHVRAAWTHLLTLRPAAVVQNVTAELAVLTGDVARARGDRAGAQVAYQAALSAFTHGVAKGTVTRALHVYGADACLGLAALAPRGQRAALLARARKILDEGAGGKPPTAAEKRLLARWRAAAR